MYPRAPQTYKSYLRTNWLKDKYAKMAYAYVPVGASPQDFIALASSISNNRVHFAGEHTHYEFLGCTHTALISGVKAAEKIIGDYIKNFTLMAFLLSVILTTNLSLKF